MIPVESYGVKVLSSGFFAETSQALAWRGPMASKALNQLFADADWGELDYLLIDLPPGTGDIHLSLVSGVPLTGAIVVSTPQKVALSDATKGLQFFNQAGINVPLLGLVENMAYFTPAELPENKYYLFGKDGGKMLAEKYKVPFLGEVPLIQAIREAGDEGKPIASTEGLSADAFIQIATNLAQQIAISNAQSNA
jgi:ATP-binding protein involved in chromosome partitioning